MAFDAYIQIDGIPGEALDEQYTNWIEQQLQFRRQSKHICHRKLIWRCNIGSYNPDQFDVH